MLFRLPTFRDFASSSTGIGGGGGICGMSLGSIGSCFCFVLPLLLGLRSTFVSRLPIFESTGEGSGALSTTTKPLLMPNPDPESNGSGLEYGDSLGNESTRGVSGGGACGVLVALMLFGVTVFEVFERANSCDFFCLRMSERLEPPFDVIARLSADLLSSAFCFSNFSISANIVRPLVAIFSSSIGVNRMIPRSGETDSTSDMKDCINAAFRLFVAGCIRDGRADTVRM